MSKASPFLFVLALFAIICVQSIDGVMVPTLHEQCVNMGFAGVCRDSVTKLTTSTSPNRCSFTLKCAVKVGNTYFKQFGGFPQNGSACGSNKVCYFGQCITATSGIMYVGQDIFRTCRKMVPVKHKITPKTTPSPGI